MELSQWRDELRDQLVRKLLITLPEAKEMVADIVWLEWWRRGFTPEQTALREQESRMFWSQFDYELFERGIEGMKKGDPEAAP